MPLTARRFLPSMIGLALINPAIVQANTALENHSAAGAAPQKSTATPQNCLPSAQRSTDINSAPVTIVADEAIARSNTLSVYRGDVVINQGHRTLKADVASLDQPNQQMVAEGNVYFHDGEIKIEGEKLETNLDNEQSVLTNAQYQMLCLPGRGEAKRVFKNGTTFYQLENGTYTTCPASDDSWRFSAGKLEKEDGDIFADLYHARFEVLDTPILYLPYLRVPVEDGRLTGFLYPSIGLSDTDGIELETPFYWNIHPQLDMVVTPKYWSNRGLFLTLEPNYLTKMGAGSMVLEYMPSDRLYPQIDQSWGFNWQHAGIQNHWKYDVNYSQVSDITYFNRYTDSRVGNREDNTLLQTGRVAYRDQKWDVALSLRNFQPLTADVSVYRLLPQLTANYYHPEVGLGLDFAMPSQISYFATDNPQKPDALRINFEPTFTLPYNLPWLSASAEGKLFYSYYDQSNIENVRGVNGATLETTASRVVPMAKLHAAVILERQGSFFANRYSQTLEPQLQYLYIKDVDQSNIYNPVDYAGGGYDTARLQTDYYGLFRANQFSSVDYINPANQFTVGAATRFFDDNYRERFNLAFGQIYYLDRPGTLSDSAINYSAWAIESELNLKNKFFLSGSMEYDSNLDKMQFGNATLEYRDNRFFAQASYRFVSKNYIASTIGDQNLDRITLDGISQVGLVTSIPITKKLQFNGQYFHDLTQDLKLEYQLALNYTSSCWSIGLGYNEYLLPRNSINDGLKYDNNLSIYFSLLGLGANAGFGYNSANGNALGYTNPFGLKH